MSRKLSAFIAGLMLSVMMVTAVFAEIVVVTKNGEKYHHAESRYATLEGVEKISKEEAEERGYMPSKDYLKRAAQADEKESK